MENLGEFWRQQLSLVEPSFDHEQNRRAAEEDIRVRESKARTLLSQLMANGIAEGIASCVGRGSNSLAIRCPDYVLLTPSLDAFLAWAREQGLDVSLFDVSAGSEDVDAKFTISLNFMPSRTGLPRV